MAELDLIKIYIIMSTDGVVAIATEDVELANDIMRIRNEAKTPASGSFGVLTMSTPRSKAIRRLIASMAKKRS